MSTYVLGTDDYELARLRLQQEVWAEVTDDFLDRLAIPAGARCLDVGSGPGFVLESLLARAGPLGRVTALDESAAWMEHIGALRAERGWSNVELVHARVEDAVLAPAAYDVVFARWVIGFLPDPGAVVRRLADSLRPGGVLALLDYNHEGISLFPESDGFRAVVRATRALYEKRGGDTWIAARLPGHLRRAGLELCVYEPYVLCGGPESPVFRWADAFFTHHCHGMVTAGLLAPEERERFLREWGERQRDPDAVFFSPIVVGTAARKP